MRSAYIGIVFGMSAVYAPAAHLAPIHPPAIASDGHPGAARLVGPEPASSTPSTNRRGRRSTAPSRQPPRRTAPVAHVQVGKHQPETASHRAAQTFPAPQVRHHHTVVLQLRHASPPVMPAGRRAVRRPPASREHSWQQFPSTARFRPQWTHIPARTRVAGVGSSLFLLVALLLHASPRRGEVSSPYVNFARLDWMFRHDDAPIGRPALMAMHPNRLLRRPPSAASWTICSSRSPNFMPRPRSPAASRQAGLRARSPGAGGRGAAW